MPILRANKIFYSNILLAIPIGLLAAMRNIRGFCVAIGKAIAPLVPTTLTQYQDGNTVENLPLIRRGTVGVPDRELTFWVKMLDDCVVKRGEF